MTEVQFEPSGRRRRCPAGETVLEAAGRAGVTVRQVCGRQANCTTCRVLVLQGAENLVPALEKEAGRLPDVRLREGWRLSCQAQVRGEGVVVVRIPTLGEWIRLRQEEDPSEANP